MKNGLHYMLVGYSYLGYSIQVMGRDVKKPLASRMQEPVVGSNSAENGKASVQDPCHARRADMIGTPFKNNCYQDRLCG
jgi:hypothetical protein